MREQANRQLVEVCHRWLEELKASAPELLDPGYSNPYFSSIPENWFETAPRIMVVGEEGFGTYGCGKQGKPEELLDCADVEKIQQLNYNYLRKQLKIDPTTDKLNISAFWRRFRKVAEHGVCCWTNIDKIHILRNRNCALNETARKQLHSVETQILSEEIRILNPTHVIFFGWHGTSLRHELPELYAMLYPGGPKDNCVWDKTVVPIQFGDRTYIFCYHPNWGYRHTGYEDLVLETLKKHI